MDSKVTYLRRQLTVDEIPLGEAYEAYRVNVLSGGTLRRSVTVSEPSWSYSLADQSADGVAVPFTIEVAQFSARVGPAHCASLDIND